MTTTVVATIESVTHRYGKTSALSDLSLDIPAQCMAGLIGPDGVGKSTLLALISGVREIQTGKVEIQTGKVMVLDGSMADGGPLMTDKPNDPLSQLAELQKLTQKALQPPAALMADWQQAFQPSVALMAEWQKAFQPSAALMEEWQKTLQSSAALVEQWQKSFAVQMKELQKPPHE